MTKSNKKKQNLSDEQRKRKRELGRISQQQLRDRRKRIEQKVKDNGDDPSILDELELKEYNKSLSTKQKTKERRSAQKCQRANDPVKAKEFKERNAGYARKNYWKRKKANETETEADADDRHLIIDPDATNSGTNSGTNTATNTTTTTSATSTATNKTLLVPSTSTTESESPPLKQVVIVRKENDVIHYLLSQPDWNHSPSLAERRLMYEFKFKQLILKDLLRWGLKVEDQCFDKLIASAVELLHEVLWPTVIVQDDPGEHVNLKRILKLQEEEVVQEPSPELPTRVPVVHDWYTESMKHVSRSSYVTKKNNRRDFIRGDKLRREDKYPFEDVEPKDIVTLEWCEPELSTSDTYTLRGISVAKAIEKVLDEEIANADEEYDVLNDIAIETYDNHIRGPPYDILFCTRSNRHLLKLRKEFMTRNVDETVILPLSRFSTTTLNKEDYFRRSFHDDSVRGYFFEAIVGHYIENNHVECLNCEEAFCMKWSGGSSSPWEDIKCVNCGSTYEVKSKRDENSIDVEVERNDISGGSF